MKNWHFFSVTKSLSHHLNYNFVCLSTYWQWKLANERGNFCSYWKLQSCEVLGMRFIQTVLMKVTTRPEFRPITCLIAVPLKIGTRDKKSTWTDISRRAQVRYILDSNMLHTVHVWCTMLKAVLKNFNTKL